MGLSRNKLYKGVYFFGSPNYTSSQRRGIAQPQHRNGEPDMANIIKSLTARIEDYRKTNKNPCKNYATEAAAEKATAATALKAAQYLQSREDAEPADYVVFYVESWGRWVGCINLSEVLRRPNAGGYLGVCADFFTW